MLIRLISHPTNNNDHIDKLIYIEGLPDSIFFREKDGKKFLLAPWEPDVEANLPHPIQEVFFKSPVKVWVEYPPIERGAQAVVDSMDVYALRLDYQTGPGETVWKQIERILDRETPRDMEVPKPRVVGDRKQWLLEAADVPAVVLQKEQPGKLVKKSENVSSVAKILNDVFECPVCQKKFSKSRALSMHQMKLGHKQETPLPTGV